MRRGQELIDDVGCACFVVAYLGIVGMVLFATFGCETDDPTGPEPVELRLTSCATFADQEFFEESYVIWRGVPSGLPCTDGLLGCPHDDQNRRYAALADTAYADGWNEGSLLEYRRCLERER